MRKLVYLFFALAIFTACSDSYKDLGDSGIYADLRTDRGNIIFELYAEQTPLTVANFITLAEGTNPKVTDSMKGKNYYDGLTFHRLVPDFIVQGGDPLANGRGGPGYKFYNEFSPELRHDSKGVVSMANGGINTNGSQFFITYKPTPWLDGYANDGSLKDCSSPRTGCHSVFGKVVFGLETLDSIAQNDTIRSIKIIRRGSKAKEFDAVKVFNTEFAKAPEVEKARVERLAIENKARQIKLDSADQIRYEKFLVDKEVFYKKMGVAKAEKRASGLQVITYKKGKGKKFNPSIPATIEYTIYLGDGKKIQSSKDSGNPLVFTLDQTPLITGVKEALETMKVGGKVRLFIPYYIGYGEAGGGPFPRKADLVFDLELIKVGQ